MNFKKTRGIILITSDFMESGKVPKMLHDLQATPLQCEFIYCCDHMQMSISSPLLPECMEGALAPTYHILLSHTNNTYKFNV